MHLYEIDLMSWMTSGISLLMLVGLASTNVTLSSTSGIRGVGIAVISSMMAKPQFSSRSQITSAHTNSIQSTEERIPPSSRRLLAVTSATVAMTTSTSMYPTLDRSFATNPYWLKVDINVPGETDIKQIDFMIAMETNLAIAYSGGKARKDAHEAAVQELLEKLNPDNDLLLNIRRKRAVTIDGNTAQVIDLSRDIDYPVNVALVFYIAEGDTSIPAGESKAIFSQLTLQEMTFYLQVVVKSFPTEFVQPVVIPTTSAPSLTVLWIVLGVLGGLVLMCLGCCFCFCFCRVCCRRPLKSPRDGPMDIDTLKMLQHKQKYPYKPYKTPNQTPRGFDVVKETNGAFDTGVAREANSSGSGVRLHNSGTGSILKKQFNSVDTTRLDIGSSSSSNSSLSDNIPEVPPLELKVVHEAALYKKSTAVTDEEDVSHQAVTSIELNSSRPRLLPLRTQIIHDGDQWSRKSEHRMGGASSSNSPQSLAASREAEELRRIYREAQREISRVLEPDIIPDQSDRTYVSPDRQTKLQGKSNKRRRKNDMQETDFGGKTSDQMLPDTHYARRSRKKQIAVQRRPEALQEAKKKVYNLIDEAFSLVGLQKNTISPAPPLATSTPPIATDQDEQTNEPQDNRSLFQRKVSVSRGSSAAEIKKVAAPLAQQSRQSDRKDLEEKGTRVVVVPVAHQLDKTAGLVWNPYSAEDELCRLQKTHQLISIPGDVEMTYKAHHTANHLTIPRAVSVPENKEPWVKGLAIPRHTDEGEKQSMSEERLANSHEKELMMDTTMLDKERRPSTSLRRLSTNSDTSKLRNPSPDDPSLYPYLKSSIVDELNGSLTLDGLTNTQEDPYAVAFLRSSQKDISSTKPQLDETDMLSTLPKEHRVGKPVADGYDEFDVCRDVTNRDNSGQLVAAIRDELVRLAKRSGQHGSNS